MPGSRCAVAGCNNSRMKTKHEAITYHSFPKDPAIKKQWIHKCRRSGKWNPDTSRICSHHFLDEDYLRDLKNELLGLPTIKRLNQAAVPSVHLGGVNDTEVPKASSSRTMRFKKRNNKKLVSEILKNSPVTRENTQENLADSELPQVVSTETDFTAPSLSLEGAKRVEDGSSPRKQRVQKHTTDGKVLLKILKTPIVAKQNTAEKLADSEVLQEMDCTTPSLNPGGLKDLKGESSPRKPSVKRGSDQRFVLEIVQIPVVTTQQNTAEKLKDSKLPPEVSCETECTEKSLNLGPKRFKITNTPQKQSVQKYDNNKLVSEILKNLTVTQQNSARKLMNSQLPESVPYRMELEIEILKEKLAESLAVQANLTAQLEKQCRLGEKLEKQRRLTQTLRTQVNRYKSKAICGSSISIALNKMFTKNQISLLLNRKKRVTWTGEEMALAFALRQFGTNCYVFLKTKLHYPLPGLSSLRRWASKLNMPMPQDLLEDSDENVSDEPSEELSQCSDKTQSEEENI